VASLDSHPCTQKPSQLLHITSTFWGSGCGLHVHGTQGKQRGAPPGARSPSGQTQPAPTLLCGLPHGLFSSHCKPRLCSTPAATNGRPPTGLRLRKGALALREVCALGPAPIIRCRCAFFHNQREGGVLARGPGLLKLPWPAHARGFRS